ncbi:MAG: phospholipid-binding protein MlaC [Candidatus Binatia bacterium]
MKNKTTVWFVLGIMGLLWIPLSLWAADPMDQISSAVDKGLQVLNEDNLRGKENRKELIARLREIVYPVFDFKEMAKRSLGAHWRRRSAEEREEFVKLFTALLEKTYASKVSLYNDQKVVFMGQRVDDSYAEVNSKVVTKKGEEFSVKYKARLEDKGWKVYDLVVENISLVNNYRSQFNRVINKSSFKNLIEKLRAKTR